jgi:hypothetical protein
VTAQSTLDLSNIAAHVVQVNFVIFPTDKTLRSLALAE